VRVTGQLIEADTGHHVWADRFDGPLDDVFDLQDRVTAAVAIEPSLRSAEIQRAQRKPTERLDAYDLYLRALPLFHNLTVEGSEEALVILRRAVANDPAFSRAKAVASMFHAFRFGSWWGDEDTEIAAGMRLAHEALDADNDDPEALRAAGYTVSYVGREHERGTAALDRALALGGAGSAPVLSMSGRVRKFSGDWRLAIAHLETAVRLSPLDLEMHYILSGISMAHFVGGQYEEAAAFARRALRLRPRLAPANRQLVASLAALGRTDEARAACHDLMALLGPRYTLASNRRRLPFRDASITERFLDGLRAAGVPD
jgi:adenylate cyclase